MKRLFLSGLVVLGFSFILSAQAFAQHQHGGSKAEPMKMESKEVVVEGVKIVFQVMENKEHIKMLSDMKKKEQPDPGTTHNIMVVLVDHQTQKEILDAQVKMKLIDPGGKDQVKTLRFEKEMKSYDGYFDLSQKGRYQVLTSFKIGDKTRNAGIYYEVK